MRLAKTSRLIGLPMLAEMGHLDWGLRDGHRACNGRGCIVPHCMIQIG